MMVSELITKLMLCSADAIVEVEGFESRAEVTSIKETFYNSPSNKSVVLKSALEYESDESASNRVDLESLRCKLERIKGVIDND